MTFYYPYEIPAVPYIKTFKRMAMARVHMQLVANTPESDGAAVTGAGVSGTGVVGAAVTGAGVAGTGVTGVAVTGAGVTGSIVGAGVAGASVVDGTITSLRHSILSKTISRHCCTSPSLFSSMT